MRGWGGVELKLRRLEAYGIVAGALYSAVLGLLSGLGLFAPMSCLLQGLLGILSSILVGVLTYPLAARKAPGPWRRGLALYTLIVVISVLAFWPVAHTTVLIAMARG